MVSNSLRSEARRFLPAAELEEFFETVGRRGIEYVVIRWFESLPRPPQSDIDFLVADHALPEFEALLNRDRTGIPCDINAESGVRGYSYGGMPYYPPELARRILERRVTVGGWVQAPCAEDHFLTLAYDCVYRKGLESGLPTSDRSLRPLSAPKHDYGKALSALAAELGLALTIDMEALDLFLAQQGWRPPQRILEHLAVDNPWLRHRLKADRRPHRIWERR